MASRKKLLTSAIALGTAAALTLGGTFAWQSINQTVLNEASDNVNPGGRLHNDQNWVNSLTNDTNIYVENFTNPDANGDTIFARVRLSEYMEIVMNYGVEGAEVVETVAGKKFDKDGNEVTDKATDKDTYTYEYAIHYFDRDAEGSEEKNATGDFFQWTTGEEDSERPYYIPTYNMNKDSLLADLNGTYVDSVGGISNRGAEQYEYDTIDEESSKSGYEIYDGDVNTADEVSRADLLDLIENGTDAANYATYQDNIVLTDVEVDHDARQVGTTRGLISMEAWLALTEDTDRYWVYDTDGWIYWSSPIEAGETTGLLLDGFTLNQVMDDTWYYAINVESQFVTADDVGRENGTGFYDTENGTAPTENAEKLLEKIGVEIGADTDEPGDEDPAGQTYDLQLSATNGSAFVAITENDNVRLLDTEGAPLADGAFTVNACSALSGSLAMTKDTDYTYENGVLTITNPTYQAAGVAVRIDVGEWSYDRPCGYIVTNPDKTLSLNQGISSSTLHDFAIVKVNETIPYVENGEYASDNKEPTVFDVTREQTTLSKESDYTLENGKVTIINDALVGHLIELQRSGYQGRYVCIGYLLVEPASATGESDDEDDTTTVKLRNITSDEYDLLCDATNESNERMHWKDMWSWTDTINTENANDRVVRGCYDARNSTYAGVIYRIDNEGWRPAFESLTPDTDCADLSVGDEVVMGTLYVGGEALKVPTNPTPDGDVTAYDRNGSGVTSKITLGAALEDTDYQVKAVYVGNGVFVCDRCMLNYISWEQLNAALTAD